MSVISKPLPLAWITGGAGLIGNCLLQTAAAGAPQWSVRGLTRADLNLTNQTTLTRLFREQKPSLIIHCAALSKSPDCQTDPPLARKLNTEVTTHLAGLAENIPFIFFSTDLVFDGTQGNYDESARVNPISVYAETKVAAEQIVMSNPRHTVIRTSLNAGTSLTGDRAFNEAMRRTWREGRTVNLFIDEFRCPIPASVTARAIWELAAQDRPGLYHLTGSERLSRYQIGQLLAARWPQLNPKIQPGSLKDYHGDPRAPDTSLNCAKAQKLLSFSLPSFSAWLAEHPEEIF